MTGKFWFSGETEETTAYFCGKYPEEHAHVTEQADRICRNIFVFQERWEMERTNEEVGFEGDVVWDYIPSGDPEWLYALNRHTCFLILGKAWRITGLKKYGEKFVELINHWIDNEPLTEKSREGTWRSLETGIRVENWLKSFFLFENCPLFTEELKDKAEKALLIHGEYLMEVNLPFHHLSNWGVLQNHGLVLLGLYFDKEEWVKEAVQRLDEETYMQVFSDGSQWEQSPMYHCEVMYGLMDSLLHLKRFGKHVPQRLEEAVRKMAYALAYWCKPDGHIPCHGDSDDIDARDLLTEAALLFGDGKLKYISREIFSPENLWNFGVQGKREFENLVSEEPLETSKVLLDAGNYFIRSSWQQEADYVKLHSGCMGSGHGHGDQLHVDYFSRGEDVLIDSGRYTYVDSPIRKELKMPSGHNTVCVDNEEFCSYSDSWGYGKMALPVKGEYSFKGKINFAMAGHLGYLDKGIFASRKVLTLGEGLLVIADIFYGKGRHSYDSYFHFGSQGRAELTEDASGRIRVHFQGKNMQAEIFALKGEKSLFKANCSLEYNRLTKCDCMKVGYAKEGQASMYTVISTAGREGQEISADMIPVSRVGDGQLLRKEQAEAIRIVKNNKEHVVIFCHQELISGVDYFAAGGYASYGRTLVFSVDNPEGVCVQY